MTTTTVERSANAENLIIVKIADMQISNDATQTLITYALGSCMGVAAYDPTSRVGGLLHFMLAEPTSEENMRIRPLAYGTVAIPAFFNALFQAGAKKERVIVKIAGGANMMRANQVFRIGEHNHEIVKNLLDVHGMTLAAEDVGGIYGRTLRLCLKDGKCYVSSPARTEVEL